ncbi:MAG: multicopper oxidase domain-containing protein, partial [Mycobacteriaceae bacterium]|nr:multicopper oxidase domain-containing protein [Mycobacteriaceae bacterium]
SGAGTAVAQSPPSAAPPRSVAVPAFAAVPRFTASRLRAVALGAPQQNGPACTPGSATVTGQVVRLDLHLRRVNTTINNPSYFFGTNNTDPLTLRTYSGCLTSPAIDAYPGDSLRITLHNDLNANDPTCGASPAPYLQLPSGVGCFNTTNFHSHGLHVSPSGISDNVLRDMPPAASPYPIQIDIPSDHPAGTFWYHAHMHGSTAVQVASADAGVLVIHGNRTYNPSRPHGIADIDTILHDATGQPFPDTVFVLQQIAYACFWTTDPNKPYDNLITSQGLYTTADANSNSPPASASAPWTCRPGYQLPRGSETRGVVENFDSQLFSPTIWDTNGRFTSINGVVQPRISVPAGQIQRWRFVHAGVHDTINLQVVRMTPTAAVPLATQLAGKSRKQQAVIVQQSCTATAATLIPQLEIAVDGLTRTKINAIDPAGVQPIPTPSPSPSSSPSPPMYPSNYLQPGYRSDVLVVFPHEGDYCLLDQSAPPSERVNNGGGGGQGPSIPQLLAYVHVAGGHAVPGDLTQYVERTLYAANATLPAGVRTALLAGNVTPWAAFQTDLPRPSPHAEPYAHFQINDANGAFTVNGQSYDPNVVQRVLVRQLGTVDDWHVEIAPQPVVPTPTPAPSGQPSPFPLDLGEPHIFHIHINPFQIVDVRRRYYDSSGKLVKTVSIYDKSGKCIPSVVSGDSQELADQYCGLWHVYRDTLFIENSFEVVLRTKYVRYTGEFVLHCHILDHEDAGMMANVQVVSDILHPPPPAHAHMPTMHRMKR